MKSYSPLKVWPNYPWCRWFIGVWIGRRFWRWLPDRDEARSGDLLYLSWLCFVFHWERGPTYRTVAPWRWMHNLFTKSRPEGEPEEPKP